MEQRRDERRSREGPRKACFVSLAPDEREEIVKLAAEDGRSVSGFLRELVRARLADEPRVRP